MEIKTLLILTAISILLAGCPNKNIPPQNNNNKSDYSKKSMY
jgi:hypothetical protein